MVTVSGNDGGVLLGIGSDLTIYEVAQIKDLFANALSKKQSIRLDFCSVSEIDSAGIQLVLSFMKSLDELGLDIECCNVPDKILSIFQLLGICLETLQLGDKAGMRLEAVE